MEKQNENEIEMDNSDENIEVLLQNNIYRHGQIVPVPRGSARRNNIINEIKVDEHRDKENFPVNDVSQQGTVNFQHLMELNQNHISSNSYQTDYDENCTNISGGNNSLNEHQACALDLSISKDGCDRYSTNKEIQNHNDLNHNDVDVSNIHNNKNTLQNSIYVYDIEKPSSSNIYNSNVNTPMHPSHSVNKPYSCEICYKKYTTKGNLQRHFEKHTGEKKFACSVCNKKFFLRYVLKEHFLIHTGEKQFSCSHCDKQFTQKNHLVTHILTRTKEKPHKCNICEKQYITKFRLNKHMSTHKK